ncbi:MAG: signal peptidase II [Christensenellaceae bacterium]|jgi:signal peptidase II|nr:signal peptidase II [Christensenellaceae bacterium]
MRNKTLVFKIFFELLLVAVFLAFDLLTKELIYGQVIKSGNDIVVIDGIISFTHAENTGAAWSIFSGETLYLGIFSLVLSVVFFIALLCLTNFRYKSIRFSLTLILGGALGNCFDRLHLGYVRDFVELTFMNYPIFNFADSELVIGLSLLLFAIIFLYKPFTPVKNEKKTALL